MVCRLHGGANATSRAKARRTVALATVAHHAPRSPAEVLLNCLAVANHLFDDRRQVLLGDQALSAAEYDDLIQSLTLASQLAHAALRTNADERFHGEVARVGQSLEQLVVLLLDLLVEGMSDAGWPPGDRDRVHEWVFEVLGAAVRWARDNPGTAAAGRDGGFTRDDAAQRHLRTLVPAAPLGDLLFRRAPEPPPPPTPVIPMRFPLASDPKQLTARREPAPWERQPRPRRSPARSATEPRRSAPSPAAAYPFRTDLAGRPR